MLSEWSISHRKCRTVWQTPETPIQIMTSDTMRHLVMLVDTSSISKQRAFQLAHIPWSSLREMILRSILCSLESNSTVRLYFLTIGDILNFQQRAALRGGLLNFCDR